MTYKQELSELKKRRVSGDDMIMGSRWPGMQSVMFDQTCMMPRQFVANDQYNKPMRGAGLVNPSSPDDQIYEQLDIKVSHEQEEMADKLLIDLVKEEKILYESVGDDESTETRNVQMQAWESIADKMKTAGFEAFIGEESRSHRLFHYQNLFVRAVCSLLYL